jgi:hypothetical protein
MPAEESFFKISAAMIIVNNPGDWGHIYAPPEHSVWNGCTPTLSPHSQLSELFRPFRIPNSQYFCGLTNQPFNDMKTAEALLSVKFTTSYKLDELNELCQADLDYFRSVRGLIQKYYIVDSSNKTVNGIYLFENKTARASYWASKLARSMPRRYGLIPGTLRVENYDVMIVLHEDVTV